MKRPEDEGASGMPSTQGGSVVKLRLANLRRICNGSMHRANGEPFTDAELTNGLREMSQRAMAAGLVIPAHHGKEAAAAASAADILHTAYSSQTPCRGTKAKAPAPAPSPPLCASATGQRAAGSSAGTRGLEPNVLGAEPRVPAGVKLLNRIAKWFLPRLGPPRSARSWLPQLSVRSGTAENILPGKDELDVAAYLAASGSPPTDVAEWQGRAAVPVSTRPVTPPPLSVRDAELCDGIAASKKTIETLISTEIAAAPLATPLTTTGCPEQSDQTPEKRKDMVLPGPADDSSVAVDSAKPTALSSDGKTGVTAPAPLPEIAAARLATDVALAGCPEQSEQTPEKREEVVLPGPADDSSVGVDGRRPASAKPTALSSDGKTGVAAPASLSEIAAARLVTPSTPTPRPQPVVRTPEKCEELAATAFCQVWDRRTEVVRKRRAGLADDSSAGVDSPASNKATSTASKHPCSMTIKEGGRTVKIAGSKAHVKMMGTYVEIEERFSRHQSFVKVGKKGAHPYFLFYLSKGWQIAKQLGSEKGCISTTSSSVRPDKARSIWHEARGAEGPKGMVCNPTIACTLVAGGAPRKHESPSHMSPTPIWVAHAATTLHVSAMQQDNGKLRGGRTAVQRALFRPTAR